MKNIMLAVVGINPQVITEALYGLYHAGRSVDSIHLITTRAGKDQIFTHLLSPYDGKMAAFMQEYNIDPAAIDCGPHTVHVLKKQSGVEIDDIVDEDDNEILLNTCLKLAFQFTARSDCAVFFLVAGGITALDQENFNSYKSKIRKSLLRRFGNGLAINLEISATGERPMTRYGIRLDKTRIRIEW